MNNTLAPLKNSTDAHVTSSSSSPLPIVMSRPPKLDVIPPSKQEEKPKIEDRPQSPTPDQQQQRKADDHQHIKDEETKTKELLKGKPIIFVGGGPGMKQTCKYYTSRSYH
jgi:hypothetical protein